MVFGNTSNFSDNQETLERCLASYVVHSPSSAYIRNSVATCVVNSIFGMAGTILNSLVVYIFWKSPRLRSKLSYFAIMVLSFADLPVVTVVHGLFVLQSVNEILENANCLYKVLYFSALYIFTGMSAAALFIMNVERYLAIVHPLRHRHWATKQKFMVACLSLWVLVLLNVISRLFFMLLSTIIVLSFTIVLSVSTLFIYVSIFHIARKRSSESKELAGRTFRGEISKDIKNFRSELRMAKTCFIIVVLTFIFYLPSGIVVGLKEPWEVNGETRAISIRVFSWTNTLISVSSTLNCVVFFWANERLRVEAKKVVSKIYTARRPLEITPSSNNGICVQGSETPKSITRSTSYVMRGLTS